MDEVLVNPLLGDKMPYSLMSGTIPFGDSIRIDKLKLGAPYVPPNYVYVLYISADSAGCLIVRQLEKDMVSTVDIEEDALISLARAGPAHVNNFELIKFTKPSYFTVVLDNEGWDFYYPDPTNPAPDPQLIHDPIAFLPQKAVIKEIPVGSGDWFNIQRTFKENYAFYNAQLVDKVIDGKPRKALRCINFWTRNAKGDPMEHTEKQNYGFNILVQVPFSPATQQSEKVTLFVDPDGQNQGPVP